MKIWLLLILMVFNASAQTKKTLNDIFSNALISDAENNIRRANPIRVTTIDERTNRIKTNFERIEDLKVVATNEFPWFITQGEEGSTIVEIKSIDTNTGWITLGETYSGLFNMDKGETLEFFNPFVNYEILNNKPLLDPYPTHINDEYIRYIQSGGLIKRAKNDYVLLTPVVFGAHKKRSVYYATSQNLINWTFHQKELISTDKIPFAKKEGNVFSTGNPLELEDSNYLVLLGVEKPDGNYSSAYTILDQGLNVIQEPKHIQIKNWDETFLNGYPLAITKHDNLYRLLVHKRGKHKLEYEIYEVTTNKLFDTLNHGINIISKSRIQNAQSETGYLRGKADDASCLIFNSELYILIGSEETPSEYLTSLNREYGLLKLENDGWVHDQRSPLLINPISIHHKYPDFEWTADHLGGFISPIFVDNYLYMFLCFGTDNPDYLLSGIRLKTN